MYPILFVRRFFVGSLVACSVLCSAPATSSDLLSYGIEDKEEAFLVRRIAEFWKDQDYQIVKTQIGDFLDRYPKSKINDHLRGILGDLYLQEGSYEEALSCYQEIQDHAIQARTILNKLQCYYETNEFAAMIQEGTPYLNSSHGSLAIRLDEFHFLMAEAYFREALDLPESKEKGDYFTSAAPLYESILNSSFNDPAMFALAEIYRQRKEHEKAASFFSELALRHLDQKEELLFHKALAESEFNKPLAIDTFAKIAEKGGVKAKDASLNRLVLLFQENRFGEVIRDYTKVAIDSDREVTFNYMIGRSYFALGDLEKSSEWLEKCIGVGEDSPEFRTCLIMQLNCAESMQNEALYAKTVELLGFTFPEDPELPNALFIHAMMQKAHSPLETEAKLEALIENYPHFADKETLVLEYGLIAYHNSHWNKSYSAFKQFVNQFPKSAKSPMGWKYFLSSAFNLVGEAANDTSITYTKADFYEDLKGVLAQGNILSQDEKESCLFLQGKVAYELGRYKETISHLESFLSSDPKVMSIAEAHLLTALSHHKLGGDPKFFSQHAESALLGNIDAERRGPLHLELYNAYIAILDQKKETKESASLYNLAANHLFEAVSTYHLPVRMENKLWLANFYYNKAFSEHECYEADGRLPKDEAAVCAKKSFALLEETLFDSQEGQLITINEPQVFLEWETMKLANLYGREGLYQKKIALLKDLIEQQNKHSKWQWKLGQESLVELAKTYELMGNYENAYETLSFIAKNFGGTPSFASEYASLHGDRLKFSMMHQESKVEENREIVKILNHFKECQIRKAPASEPLHLEAALEYAWMRAHMTQDEDRAMRYLFFLHRIQEDYNNLEDPMVESYHKHLRADSKKELLYQTYMKFLDIEMKRCEAILALKENKTAISLALDENAKKDLKELLEKTSSHYLQKRAKQSLEALDRATLL